MKIGQLTGFATIEVDPQQSEAEIASGALRAPPVNLVRTQFTGTGNCGLLRAQEAGRASASSVELTATIGPSIQLNSLIQLPLEAKIFVA